MNSSVKQEPSESRSHLVIYYWKINLLSLSDTVRIEFNFHQYLKESSFHKVLENCIIF